jgi:hypothetical protein
MMIWQIKWQVLSWRLAVRYLVGVGPSYTPLHPEPSIKFLLVQVSRMVINCQIYETESSAVVWRSILSRLGVQAQG